MSIKIGDVFETKTCGKVVVIELINNYKIKVAFLETGYVCNARPDKIRNKPRLFDRLRPTVFGVGCIGVGKHKAHYKGADTPIYRVWRAMLRRCYYRPKNKKIQKSYRGCRVTNEWLNFQNYADWYIKNYPNDGNKYQVDKDIILPGNKLYHPDFCTFVTQRDNLKHRQF